MLADGIIIQSCQEILLDCQGRILVFSDQRIDLLHCSLFIILLLPLLYSLDLGKSPWRLYCTCLGILMTGMFVFCVVFFFVFLTCQRVTWLELNRFMVVLDSLQRPSHLSNSWWWWVLFVYFVSMAGEVFLKQTYNSPNTKAINQTCWFSSRGSMFNLFIKKLCLLFLFFSFLCLYRKLKQPCALTGRAKGRVLPLGNVYPGKTQETFVWSDSSRLCHKPSWAKKEKMS